MEDDLTDMIVDSRECMYEKNQTADESDLTTAYLKGYADAEEKYKKRIKELEEALLKVKDKNTTLFITCRNSIPVQKVINKINYCDERIKHAKQIRDKEQEEFYIDLKRAFNKLLEDK